MSDKRTSVELKTTGPGYLGWRGELLAELALARVPGLSVHKRPERAASELPAHFLAATSDGLCFFVIVRASSSFQMDIPDVETIGELRWPLEAETIRRARESRSPVILFLFDADTDHGRYLCLDTLPDPGPEARSVMVRLPVSATINKENLEKLIGDLRVASRA